MIGFFQRYRSTLALIVVVILFSELLDWIGFSDWAKTNAIARWVFAMGGGLVLTMLSINWLFLAPRDHPGWRAWLYRIGGVLLLGLVSLMLFMYVSTLFGDPLGLLS